MRGFGAKGPDVVLIENARFGARIGSFEAQEAIAEPGPLREVALDLETTLVIAVLPSPIHARVGAFAEAEVALARMRGTIVLMMAVERIGAFADALVAGGRPADTPVAVVQDGTMRIQRSLRATLATVADEVREQGINPPAVVVVGPVAGLVDSPVTTSTG